MKYSDLNEKTPFYILLLPWIVSLIIFSFIIAYLAILYGYDAKIIILCQFLVQYELIGNILRLYKNNSRRIKNLNEIKLTDLKLKEMSGTNVSSISQKFLDDSKWLIQYNKRIIRKFLLVLLVRVFSFTILTLVFIKIFYFFL